MSTKSGRKSAAGRPAWMLERMPRASGRSMVMRVIPVADLRLPAYNPRVDLQPEDAGYKALRRSLDDFGYVQPIVVNKKTGNVVGGRQRLAILQNENGDKEVACVVVSLDAQKEKALNVALNNGNVGGEWDSGRLVTLLTELRDDPGVDETATGFSEEALRSMLDDDGGTDNGSASGRERSDVTGWAVIVDCKSAADQTKKLKLLRAQGHKCRPLKS